RKGPAATSSKATRHKKSGVRPPEVGVPPQTHEAQFIFRGTVVQRGAATLAQVAETEDTIVVVVEEILQAPEALRDYEGQHVTVKLGPGQEEEDNQQYVFETIGWLFGDSIAVICVNLSPADSPSLEHVRA